MLIICKYRYDSFNTDVIKQHLIWMIEAGLLFILLTALLSPHK